MAYPAGGGPVVAPTEKEVDPAVLAGQISKISEAMQALLKSGLNEEAIVILLHHDTRVAQRDIRRILQGLKGLAGRFTTLRRI